MEVNNEFERSWADLPELVLYKIFSLVSLDCSGIGCSLVCKSWNSIFHITPHRNEFELNTPIPHVFFTNKLIHPTSKMVYEVNKFPETILGVQLRTAKDDWLLLTQNSCAEFDYGKVTPCKAFFFNPFTRATLWLPNPLGILLYSMCFTSPPTSTDFKVVVVRRGGEPEEYKISIDTLKCGEDRWSTCEFDHTEDLLFEFSYCNPVLSNDICYILDENSKLLIHNGKDNTFFIHEPPEFLVCNIREQYMLKSDGKLLAVFVNVDGSWVVVCSWNVLEKKWEKLESLGNKTLFVSRPYSLSEEIIGLENRIYFPRFIGGSCLFYSLDTKLFHTYDGTTRNGFIGSKSTFSSTWIKPRDMMKIS